MATFMTSVTSKIVEAKCTVSLTRLLILFKVEDLIRYKIVDGSPVL